MKRSKSSKKWLNEHFKDEYVQKSQQEGYRSRAVYKLKAIDEKHQLIRQGMTIIDLGAAPGGWSQYVAEKMHVGSSAVGQSAVIALDILPMKPLMGVDIIEGDFHEDEVLAELKNALPNHMADLILSDMAPNMTGLKAVDIPRAMGLCELAFDLAREVLKPGGSLLMKVFHGAGFDELLKLARHNFKVVSIQKPDASRARSRETYLLAKGYNV